MVGAVRPGGPRAHAAAPPGVGSGAPLSVLIDGRNVQGALERGAAPGSMPTAALVARLRAAFSPPTRVELVLDGHAGGSPAGRIAPGFSVTFRRGAAADDVIADRVAEALRELGPAGAWSIVVVSDDRAVQGQARRHGARAEGTAWLLARLAGSTGVGAPIGHGRPPRNRRLG